MDKGNHRLAHTVPAMLQKEKINGVLSSTHRQRGDKVASNRVLVENILGRQTQLYSILDKRFKFSEENNDNILQLCCCFTNSQDICSPLPEEDSVPYQY